MFRFFLLILLIVLVPQSLFAQRAALSVGYTYGLQSNLDNAVQHFNFTYPTHGQHPPIRHGFYGGLEYSMALGSKRLFLSPKLSYWQTQSKSNSFVFPVQSTMRSIEVQIGADVYVLASSSRRGSRHAFSKSFFCNAHLGVARLSHQVTFAQKTRRVRDAIYQPTAIAPFVGIGVGYDIFTLPTFSFTPEIQAGYMAPFTFEDLGLAYTGGSLLKTASTSGRIYIKMGVAMRVHALRSTYR